MDQSRRLQGVAAVIVAVAVAVVPGQPVQAAPAPCSSGDVALTFDDGPFEVYTPGVLDVLAHKRVPATFFVVGSRVERLPGILRRQHAERHTIGNHTYSHDRLTELTSAQIRQTLTRTDEAVVKMGLPRPRHMRPPYLATNARVRSVAADLGLAHVLAEVNPKDWRAGQQAATTVRLTLGGLGPGRRIILHERAGYGQTVSALPRIIDGARVRGYCFGVLNRAGKVVPASPAIRAVDAAAAEGSGGLDTVVRVPVRMHVPTSRTVTVEYRTRDGTARASSDYTGTAGRLTFRPGQHTGHVAVRVRADDTRESDEQLTIELRDAVNGRITRAVATLIIRNDD